ncbi:hypothetical protein [Streptomyces sp. BK205]|uniref:hypothetical protein n=1 Tax=Streptomyces sp. BK205 TaxID=2512164 RepID=UPI0010ED143F|nr:hypothetical protein [Streptomyces sp. BK205]TCR22932.1 hypothetical protein EV578_104262 [Streptomyces sp. BK205]
MTATVDVSYHPAGLDEPLRPVLEDVRAGRWRAMRTLLADTGSWALRTARSQVLAAAAAPGDAVEAWGAERREHDWLMMHARVQTQRALRAHRDRAPSALPIEGAARRACHAAIRSWPQDPVPWVTLLALAQIDNGPLWNRQPEHRMPPWERGLPAGPWGLLAEIQRRDPDSREGWHRMLQALDAYQEGVTDFVRWASSHAPPGSPRTLLPLYVYVEIYRQRQATKAGAPLFWTTDPVAFYTARAATHWFAHSVEATRSALDLNYTAQALHFGGFRDLAVPVFKAIGPHATPAPWKYVAAAPQLWGEEFQRARRRSLPEPARTHPAHRARARR